MKTHIFAIIVLFMLFAFPASAQSPCPPDVSLTLAAGVYDFHMDPDGETGLLQICCQRVDVSPIVDLGCIDATSPPVDPLVGYPMSVTVAPTPQDDAELRCYSEDVAGLISVLSCNKADLDFTAPRAPHLKN